MTRAALYARAVSYDAAYQTGLHYTRPYQDLRQADLEVFWSCVTEIRGGKRLYRKFWADQFSHPEALP